MKKIPLVQGSEEWKEWRKGKVTGTRVKDLIVKRGTEKKLGFYEVIAERLSTDTSDVQNPMERGKELEAEALVAFQAKSGKKVKGECGVWVSDINESIALSPDGEVGKTEALEIKCLSSSRHLQAYFEQKVPSEYEDQTIQYFVVNEKLKTLYVAFYDPRIKVLPIHYLTLKREDLEEKIEYNTQYQLKTLEEVNRLINELNAF